MSSEPQTTTDESTANGSSVKQFLADHPRAMGVLFTLAVLLTQATPALAGGARGLTGP